jgi:N-acetylmuramoyl-L-alanine amidase
MIKRKRIVVWLELRAKLKLILAALLVAFMMYVFTFELPATKTWTYWTMPLSGKVIALDPGHGGPDGGAVSKDGVVEKDITLAISLYLRDYLQQAGALVVMTREEDKDLADPDRKGLSRRKTQDLINRATFVKERDSDLFLSIHLNAVPSSRWSGAQTFYYTGQHEDNKLLAALIQDEIIINLQNTTREANRIDNIYLLKTIEVPSALVEVGFLSNPEEAEKLQDEKYQKQMAESIYRGILRYTSGDKLGSP